jgi:hypothetical protein
MADSFTADELAAIAAAEAAGKVRRVEPGCAFGVEDDAPDPHRRQSASRGGQTGSAMRDFRRRARQLDAHLF